MPPERTPDAYRKQGWVAPVVLVNRRVAGTCSQERKGRRLRARVAPFSRLSRTVERAVVREPVDLARFASCDGMDVVMI